MKQATFEQTMPINADRLHEEIKAVLGDKYESIDTGVPQLNESGKADDTKPRSIVVRAKQEATEADLKLVEAAIAAHKPEALSQSQQREKDRAESFLRLKGFDFTTLRALKTDEQLTVVIDLLEDIQKLMQGIG